MRIKYLYYTINKMIIADLVEISFDKSQKIFKDLLSNFTDEKIFIGNEEVIESIVGKHMNVCGFNGDIDNYGYKLLSKKHKMSVLILEGINDYPGDCDGNSRCGPKCSEKFTNYMGELISKDCENWKTSTVEGVSVTNAMEIYKGTKLDDDIIEFHGYLHDCIHECDVVTMLFKYNKKFKCWMEYNPDGWGDHYSFSILAFRNNSNDNIYP